MARGSAKRKTMSSDEILQAYTDVVNEMPSNRKLSPRSQKQCDDMLRRWNEYKCRRGKPYLHPDIANLKTFFLVLGTESNGMIGDLASVHTLTTYCHYLMMALSNEPGLHMPVTLRQELRKYIENDLKEKLNLSTAMREKPIANIGDVEDMLRFLWIKDTHAYKSSRSRVQLAFFILILAFTAARPGAVVESCCYFGSNDAIKYKDISLWISKNPDGGAPLKVMYITFHLMKGDREEEENFVSIPFREDRDNPQKCIVGHFLSLAFADGAIDGFDDPGDLTPENFGRDLVKIDFKEQMLNIPILRAPNSSTRSWTYNAVSHALGELGWRMGYGKRLTPYAIRRAVANDLVESGNWNIVSKILGHGRESVFQKSYASNITTLDVQSIFNQQAPKTGHIRAMNSMRAFRHYDLPTHLPEHMITEDFYHTDKMDKLRRDLLENPLNSDRIRKAMKIERGQIKRAALDTFRQKLMKSDGNQYLQYLQDLKEQSPPMQNTPEASSIATETSPSKRAIVVKYAYQRDQNVPSFESWLLFVRALRDYATVETLQMRAPKLWRCPIALCVHHECPYESKEEFIDHCINQHILSTDILVRCRKKCLFQKSLEPKTQLELIHGAMCKAKKLYFAYRDRRFRNIFAKLFTENDSDVFVPLPGAFDEISKLGREVGRVL